MFHLTRADPRHSSATPTTKQNEDRRQSKLHGDLPFVAGEVRR